MQQGRQAVANFFRLRLYIVIGLVIIENYS